MSCNLTTLKCKPKRYLWIDNLKMFACLLVVIGHLYMSMMAGGWINENKLCASDHAMNAIDEMSALNRDA